MRQRCHGARFLLEPPQAIGIGAGSLRQHLDRDVAPEAGVTGAVDLAHATGAKRGDDLVRSKATSSVERHEM